MKVPSDYIEPNNNGFDYQNTKQLISTMEDGD